MKCTILEQASMSVIIQTWNDQVPALGQQIEKRSLSLLYLHAPNAASVIFFVAGDSDLVIISSSAGE